MFFKLNQYLQMDFNNTIPNNLNQTLLKEAFWSILQRNFRTFRRYLILIIHRQTKLQKVAIPSTAKSILWLNISSTSIGDSIMELSGRSLLPANIKLDLLTDQKNAAIYVEDNYFATVYTDINSCSVNHYDLILIDIHNTKSLRAKAKYFKKIAFCAIQGYFYGCDFHRMLFSYNRINALLNYPIVPINLNYIAKNYLHFKDSDTVTTLTDTIHIGIAIGGVDNIRTYNQWDLVIESIIMQAQSYNFNLNSLRISLLGIDNKSNISEQIAAKYQDIFVINNQVNQLSLLATAKIIQHLDYFLGCDGGLMHIAEAFNLKGVALFAKFNPNLRLSMFTRLTPIYSEQSSSDIAPQLITKSLMTKLINT